MSIFITIIHVIACVILVIVILMQSGRGGGLTEGFAPAESIFGAQTNEFMIKATTVLSVVFFVTCLSLAVLSTKKGKSLMSDKVAVPMQVQDQPSDKTLEDVAQPLQKALEEISEPLLPQATENEVKTEAEPVTTQP